jgi:hypothetical protein
MLDKFGGDTIADTRDNLARYRDRIAAPIEPPAAGGRRGRPASAVLHGLAGSDVAGSGGDD